MAHVRFFMCRRSYLHPYRLLCRQKWFAKIELGCTWVLRRYAVLEDTVLTRCWSMAANLSGSKSWLTYLRSWKLTGRLSRISQSHGFASVVVHRDTPAPHCTEKISYLRLHVRSSAASIVGYFRQGYNCHQIRTPCWGCAPSFNAGLSGHHTRSPQQPSYNIHYGRSKKSRVKIEKRPDSYFHVIPPCHNSQA